MTIIILFNSFFPSFLASLVVNENGSFLAGVWASNIADLNQYIQVKK